MRMETFPSYLQVEKDDGPVIESSTAEDLFSDLGSDPGTLSALPASSLGSPDYRTVYHQNSLPIAKPYQLAIPEDFNGTIGHIPYSSTLHYEYYPTSPTRHPSLDVVAYGGSQSCHIHSLNLVYSDGAFQNVPSFQHLLPSFADQTTVNEMPCILSPHPSPQGGSLPTGGTVMSLAPAPLSGGSGLTSVHLPLGAPATGNDPQGYCVRMPAHVPPRKVKSKCFPPVTSTSKARILEYSTPPCDQRSTTTRLRAQLGATRSVSYGSGCRLDLIGQGENIALLGDHSELALPGHTFTQKASILFEFESYQPFNYQFNVLLRKNQPTKHRLAKVVVKAVERFIRDCAGRGQPFPYKLEHLMLRSIEVVSRSSIRPVFELVTPPSA